MNKFGQSANDSTIFYTPEGAGSRSVIPAPSSSMVQANAELSNAPAPSPMHSFLSTEVSKDTVGAGVGALAGMMLVGGPVGAILGGALGWWGTKKYVHRNE